MRVNMHTRSQNYLWLLGAGAASATGGAVERTKIVLDFWYISALLSLFGSCPLHYLAALVASIFANQQYNDNGSNFTAGEMTLNLNTVPKIGRISSYKYNPEFY